MDEFGTLEEALGPCGVMLDDCLCAGELKDPSRAIPLGTIIAVAYTLFIYTLLFFLSGFTCDRCAPWRWELV